MSFANLDHPPPTDSPPSPTIPPAAQSPSPSQLHGTLNALSANTQALRRLAQQVLSSPSPESLHRIRQLRAQNRDLARIAASLAAKSPNEADQQRFKAVLTELRTALAQSVEAEHSSIQALDGVENQTALLQESQASIASTVGYGSVQQPDQAVLREISTNDQFVRERNIVLEQIHTSVTDVNHIFQDLAEMIGDQQAQVDYVEVTVADANIHVDRGVRELRKTAMRRERKKGIFFALLFTAAIIISLFLIILFK